MINIKNILEKPKTLIVQIVLIKLVFLIFFLNVFISLPSWILFLLVLIIIGNIVLGIINKKRNLIFNFVLLILSLLSFVFLIGYFATIIGAVIGFIYALVFYFKVFRDGEEVKKEDKKKEIEKGKGK